MNLTLFIPATNSRHSYLAAILTLINSNEQFFTTSKIQHQLNVNTSILHHKNHDILVFKHTKSYY